MHLRPVLAILMCSVATTALADDRGADARAQQLLGRMTLDEKLTILRGYQPHQLGAADRPNDLALGAGFVPGVPRLGVPPLAESDASLGVANMVGQMRPGDVATALPSAAAMAATFNPELVERAGAAIGAETRAKGFSVLLAGGVNLVREPRGGRNFEYFSEDPLVSGVLGGHAIRGIQSNRVISTIKHYALNAQETGRSTLTANMDEAALRESDLLAFQIAIEIGQPGSVMCAYNQVNGVYACENSFLLNDVLRRDWGYKGFVMSDWGAVHSPSIRQGLDQESGTNPKTPPYFSAMLRSELAAGRVAQADIDRSAHRILRSMYAHGLMDDPPKAGGVIDYDAHGDVAQQIAEQGVVLLKNANGVLPIARSAKRILIVGGHADKGVLAGGGSSQVWPVGGAALALPIPGEPVYHQRLYMPSSPMKALQELLPQATVTYDDGADAQRAAAAAHDADLVLVFAEQFTAEGHDLSSLNLPDGQDELIEAIAKANARTVVVLETGGPVAMPWVNRVGAVLAAWYPGQRGGHAIARVLTGEVNPSGRLPVTFPASLDQTPNPKLPGSNLVAEHKGDLYDLPKDEQHFPVTYPEGSDVGYRWYAKTGAKPLFAFGHGLSYTRFSYADLKVTGGSGLEASFRLTNVGRRAGAEVAQLYVKVGQSKRLVGWSRVQLQPGETREVRVKAEPRILAKYDTALPGWRIAPGEYLAEVGPSAAQPILKAKVRLQAVQLKP